ncbi:hypothetical protein TNCV_915871 [Trichonephila clavipes]|nr:hypothetical protein TNCV_915871 [Trichonephila clavipes]
MFDHSSCNPELDPNNCHLFPKLKEFLDGKSFESDEELENVVNIQLNTPDAKEYNTGILKLVKRNILIGYPNPPSSDIAPQMITPD